MPSQHLLVQSHQQKHQINLQNQIKVNHEDTSFCNGNYFNFQPNTRASVKATNKGPLF